MEALSILKPAQSQENQGRLVTLLRGPGLFWDCSESGIWLCVRFTWLEAQPPLEKRQARAGRMGRWGPAVTLAIYVVRVT